MDYGYPGLVYPYATKTAGQTQGSVGAEVQSTKSKRKLSPSNLLLELGTQEEISEKKDVT